jgi:hypothetical protein
MQQYSIRFECTLSLCPVSSQYSTVDRYQFAKTFVCFTHVDMFMSTSPPPPLPPTITIMMIQRTQHRKRGRYASSSHRDVDWQSIYDDLTANHAQGAITRAADRYGVNQGWELASRLGVAKGDYDALAMSWLKDDVNLSSCSALVDI